MINLITPLNDLGYGIVGKNIAKALYNKYSNLKIYPMGPTENLLNVHKAGISQGRYIDRTFPDLRIWHQFDMGYFISNKVKSGLTFFELDVLTKEEVSHLNSLDILFLPSYWHIDVARANGVASPKMVNLPMSVDTETFLDINTEYKNFVGYNNYGIMIFDEDKNKQDKPPTVFINCGKWEIRKGHDIIIECFEEVFDERDNVRLIMNCQNPFIDNNHEWEERYNAPNVKVIKNRLFSQSDLAKLFYMADVGIFPARAEGSNLEACELLAMGKHCIMSNYSGHEAYAVDAGAATFNFSKFEPADDGVFFDSAHPKWSGNPGKWGRITEKEKQVIKDYMWDFHVEKQAGRLKKNEKGLKFFKEWTWGSVADRIILNITEA